MKKKNTGQAYEKLTQQVFSQIVNLKKNDIIDTIDVQHDVTIQGKTTSHQIDVYWEFKVGNITYRTIIQAKDWKSKVKQEHMYAFKGVLEDFPFGTNGIFVSRSGFQSGAVEVANKHGIKIYELRKPKNSDFEGLLNKIILSIHIRTPDYKNIKIGIDESWVVANKIDIKSIPFRTGVSSYDDLEIVDESGTHICGFVDLLNQLAAEASDDNIHLEKHLDNKYFKTREGSILKIRQISGDFGYRESVETMEFEQESIVALILKDLTDGQILRFDKNVNLLGGKRDA